jgi:Reverse transcriptase (RNA-dependent DNA polymerase)
LWLAFVPVFIGDSSALIYSRGIFLSREHRFRLNYRPSSTDARIEQRLSTSRTSEFHPAIVMNGGRAVTGVNFDGVARRRAEILARYGRYVKTDIARFYPSVYTHSVAWSLYGKDWVKENMYSAAFKRSFANRLDQAIAAGQEGQTIGIPIGPDTSRIVSELIACAIEDTVRSEIEHLDERCVRYVDDMLIGLQDTDAADAVLSKLTAALYDYQLELNGHKTSVHGLGVMHRAEWRHFLKGFGISMQPGGQRDDIDSYFEQAIHLAEINPPDDVMLYAARRAMSFVITPANWKHFVHWLLYACRRSSSCPRIVVEHLSFLHRRGTSLPTSEIQEFVSQQIIMRAEAAHTSEIAWLLFWARELKMPIDARVVERVLRLRSGVNALLTLELRQLNLINGTISDDFRKGGPNSAFPKGDMTDRGRCEYGSHFPYRPLF